MSPRGLSSRWRLAPSTGVLGPDGIMGPGEVLRPRMDKRGHEPLLKNLPAKDQVDVLKQVFVEKAGSVSGFFSKDAILLAAHAHHPWMYWVGVVTAGMMSENTPAHDLAARMIGDEPFA